MIEETLNKKGLHSSGGPGGRLGGKWPDVKHLLVLWGHVAASIHPSETFKDLHCIFWHFACPVRSLECCLTVISSCTSEKSPVQHPQQSQKSFRALGNILQGSILQASLLSREDSLFWSCAPWWHKSWVCSWFIVTADSEPNLRPVYS